MTGVSGGIERLSCAVTTFVSLAIREEVLLSLTVGGIFFPSLTGGGGEREISGSDRALTILETSVK